MLVGISGRATSGCHICRIFVWMSICHWALETPKGVSFNAGHEQHNTKTTTERLPRPHRTPLLLPVPVPLVPLVVRDDPKPLPICEPPRMLELAPPTPPPVPAPPRNMPPRVPPRTPLTPLTPDPRPAAEPVPAIRALSCSSALRWAASRRRSSSAALRSRACWRAAASASMSCRSWVEPFQLGLRMSRWLCSVCERMRVQVLRRVEALSTV